MVNSVASEAWVAEAFLRWLDVPVGWRWLDARPGGVPAAYVWDYTEGMAVRGLVGDGSPSSAGTAGRAGG
jgi:hypothetical protein